MMQKITVWFTSGSGLSLIALFIIGGLTAIESHTTGNVQADIEMIVSVLGLLFHPVDLQGGLSVKK